MYDRYKNGGYINGDYVTISKKIVNSDFFKNLPGQTQEYIQSALDTDLRLRVSSVNSIRPANQPGDGGVGAAGDFVADIVIEYAPGLYRNPLSLPVNFLELQSTGVDGFGTLPTPDSLIKKTPVHGPESIESQSLPTQNTTIPNSNSYPDAPGGVDAALYKKDHKAGTRIAEAQLEDVYADIIEKKSKPDYLDVDQDGDKKEPFKKALKDKGKSTPKNKDKK